MLGLFSLLLITLIIFIWVSPCTPIFPSKKISKNEIRGIVNSFVRYTLYFRGLENDAVCTKDSAQNITESMIFEIINSCPNPNYRPRKISRAQISWKPVDHSSTGKRNHQKSNGKGSDNSFEKKMNRQSDKEKEKDKVHRFLAFALLLPEHPYSMRMLSTIKQVAPMFPQVSFIVGSANEFSDLSTKYLIHSYPSLLFFKNGIYVGDYSEEKVDVAELAVFFSTWTRSFPRSVPNTIPASEIIDAIESKQISPVDWMRFLPKPNLEPLLGSVDSYQELDIAAFLVTGIYCLVRVVVMLVSNRQIDRI